MKTISVALLDEREVFRRGLVACLAEDPHIEVVGDNRSPAPPADVAVVSESIARTDPPDCPLVVCHDSVLPGIDEVDNVYGHLRRDSLTADQLIGAVRAAAAGLRIEPNGEGAPALDRRGRAVLGLLAEGAGTDEIAAALGCSPRTVKADLARARRVLGARSRAHAVAEAVRRSLI